jgi:concanavalin A-like lectin/glucanase superfamily protein
MKAAVFVITLFALVLVGVPGFSQEAEPVSNVSSPSGAVGDLSIQFKGVSSVGADDPDGLLNIIEGPITIECWVQLDAFNDNWTGLASWGFTYKMGIANNGEFLFTFFGIADIFSGYSLVPFVGDGQWHHLAGAWEPGAGVSFYVDGVMEAFVEQTGMPRDPTSTNFTVGGEDVGNVPVTAKMDRVRIHNAVLTEADLDSNAASPKAPMAETLVSYGFDEGSAPYKSTGSVSLDLLDQNAVAAPSAASNWEIYQ